jgi:hypothetical protein
MYSAIEMAKGELPWRWLKGRAKTAKMKAEMTAAELCRGLPGEFAEIWKVIKKLRYSEAPDYEKLRGLLKSVIERTGGIAKPKFDWEMGSQERFSGIFCVSLAIKDDTEALPGQGSETGCGGCEIA